MPEILEKKPATNQTILGDCRECSLAQLVAKFSEIQKDSDGKIVFKQK